SLTSTGPVNGVGIASGAVSTNCGRDQVFPPSSDVARKMCVSSKPSVVSLKNGKLGSLWSTQINAASTRLPPNAVGYTARKQPCRPPTRSAPNGADGALQEPPASSEYVTRHSFWLCDFSGAAAKPHNHRPLGSTQTPAKAALCRGDGGGA